MSTQTFAPTLTAAAPITAKRVVSIDLLRGVVMIIMTLDHVRDYFHRDAFLYDPTNLEQTSVPIFFTRWITHYCAPIFMLLAGVAAHLYGAKRDRKSLSYFLLTRGLWLIIAEVLIVTLGWTFNPAYPVLILQVIFAFGVSMIVLSALIYLPLTAILIIGLLLAGAHNVLDGVHVPGDGGGAVFWAFLHEQRFFSGGRFSFFAGYPLIPWIGIIAIGYWFGSLYRSNVDPARRKKILLTVGAGAIVLFIIVRMINGFGDPRPWAVQKNGVFTLLSFINVTKYPPSLLYSLITIGPALIFLALTENVSNAFSRFTSVFGRVPMFFYLVHIYFIHALALLGAIFSGYQWSDMVVSTWISAEPGLRGYGYSLTVVYIIWIGTVLLLYPLCKWFDRYKRSHPEKVWLSYL